MADDRRPVSFGLSLDPSVERLAETVELARAADGRLDWLAVQDHPYLPGHLDAWTLITYLAARTERIGLLTAVAGVQLRPPATLAKAAASLATIIGGRLALGVGGGGVPAGVAGMTGVRRTGPEMVAYTAEALDLIRRALAGDAAGYTAGPVAEVPIWLGAQAPRMLELAGRLADGWVAPLNTYLPAGDVPGKQQAIDAAARDAGRDPRSIRRVCGITRAAQVEEWIGLGFDTVILWPEQDPAAELERFLAATR